MGQGAFIFGCEGQSLTRWERDFFAEAQPWGFILFGRNVHEPDQIRWLTTELREAVGRDAPIFIDQEGGRVARLTAPHWREWLPALDQVRATGTKAVHGMYLRYRLIAHELHAMGIDGNCAPVLDLLRDDTHAIIANRCYGDDVVSVSEIAGAVATALVDGGVLPVIKHIPGHGRANLDSHLALPRVNASAKALAVSDFLAFKSVSKLPLAMTAHVVFEDIDPDRPATTSPEVIRLIRDQIGFGGLLMTDDISMKALTGPIGSDCKAALAAGCDLILHCNGKRDEMEAVAKAAGTIAGMAAVRAEAALGWRRDPDTIDIQALDAEFQSLLGQSAR